MDAGSQEFCASEFDEWAESYDQSVAAGCGFPFEGYERVLEAVEEQADPAEGAAVLDLGTGTGNLALHFARRGCQVWGLDFADGMLAQARHKLPGVRLAQADVRGAWPVEFLRRYACIVSGYTFHHFPLEEKVQLAHRLVGDHLLADGCLVIGDVAFQHATARDALRCSLGDAWEEEYFWLADETLAAFSAVGLRAAFTPISFCGGVFKISA